MSSDEYLKIHFLEENAKIDIQNVIVPKSRILPFARSDVYFAPIKSTQKLTQGDDVKHVYQLTLDIKDVNFEFSPGDTIGIIPANNAEDVCALIQRLNISNENQPCRIGIAQSTAKKNVVVPKHLPADCVTTIKNVFTFNVDIQTVPKKLFLKSLMKYTTGQSEKQFLELIISPKGSKEYNALINNEGKTLLGLLNHFPTCQPPVEVLLEHLPALLPRPYSISSSPLQKDALDLTFFLLEKDDGRLGLCTSWLVQNPVSKTIPFYFRQSNTFHLRENHSDPLILIATGTGIAPFRSFLQHCSLQSRTNKIWLVFGCRYKRNCLYRAELENYLKEGVITQLDLAFSRDCNEYVQNKIDKCGKQLIKWIVEENATVFVCGNAQTMVKDVEKCVLGHFNEFGHDGTKLLGDLKLTGRYVVDSWT